MTKVAVLGAGSWGTALSLVLHDNGHDVRLWSHRKEQVEIMNTTHKNERYLDCTLPNDLQVYHQLAGALNDVEAIVLVVPTKAIRDVTQRVKEVLKRPVTLIHATKGIEPGTLKRVSEMIAEEMPEIMVDDIVVLSGPSHAEEVAKRQPTTVTVSSPNNHNVQIAQDLFMNKAFRVYTSSDIIGVELGGSLKNIIALGAGISDGLGYGDNAKAALITRGLAEIARLGTSLGANPLTFLGLPGVGDLIVTCTSIHSRNWRCGNMLGSGMDLDEVLGKMGMVVEGVRTTKAAHEFAMQQQIDMPITNGLYRILFDHAEAKVVVDELMNRTKRDEMDDIAILLANKHQS